MITDFKKIIETQFPELLDAPVLVALSGGRDSSVLVDLCRSSGIDFGVAHCNFHLRGLESDQDEELCRNIAEEYDMPIFVKEFSIQSNDNIQLKARELRYDWFLQLIQTTPFKYILTAHHQDDNIETFLMNLERGTSLDGVTGIPARNGDIYRPLLSFSRQQIADYARQHGISYREDSSNLTDNYLRNRIRHHLSPVLREVLPGFAQGFERSQKYLGEDLELREELLNRFRESVINTDSADLGRIDLAKAESYGKYDYLIFLHTKEMGFNRKQINDILEAGSGASVSSATHTIWKDRNNLLLSAKTETAGTCVVINGAGKYKWRDGEMVVDFPQVDDPLAWVKENTSSKKLYLEADEVKFPLVLRDWQNGDKIEPFGMQGSKLVSDIFIDQKLSPVEKRHTPVLCEGGMVLWAVGVRGSRHYAITEQTKNLCRITWES